MNTTKQWIVVGACIALFATGIVAAAHSMSDSLPIIEVGSLAPDFVAVPITGPEGNRSAPKSMADYRGQVVLLNLWATWCGPCVKEMPSIQALYDELGPKGLKVVAVSVDNPGMEEVIRAFGVTHRLTFELLHDDRLRGIQEAYLTTGVPETFVIGRDGTIRKRVSGGTDWNTPAQKALVRQLLDETAQ